MHWGLSNCYVSKPTRSKYSFWYQKEDAPPYFSISVKENLDKMFGGRYIGLRDTIEWLVAIQLTTSNAIRIRSLRIYESKGSSEQASEY